MMDSQLRVAQREWQRNPTFDEHQRYLIIKSRCNPAPLPKVAFLRDIIKQDLEWLELGSLVNDWYNSHYDLQLSMEHAEYALKAAGWQPTDYQLKEPKDIIPHHLYLYKDVPIAVDDALTSKQKKRMGNWVAKEGEKYVASIFIRTSSPYEAMRFIREHYGPEYADKRLEAAKKLDTCVLYPAFGHMDERLSRYPLDFKR